MTAEPSALDGPDGSASDVIASVLTAHGVAPELPLIDALIDAFEERLAEIVANALNEHLRLIGEGLVRLAGVAS